MPLLNKLYGPTPSLYKRRTRCKAKPQYDLIGKTSIRINKKENYLEFDSLRHEEALFRLPLSVIPPKKGKPLVELASLEFRPSSALVSLFVERMDDQEYGLGDARDRVRGIDLSLIDDISEELNGLLVNLSRRNIENNISSPYEIARNGRLCDTFKFEIISRFGLCIDNLSPLLKRLNSELYNYANEERTCKWGKLYCEKENKSIFVKADVTADNNDC